MTRRQDRQRTGMRTAHGPRARGAALLLSGALGPGCAAAETPPAVEPEGPRVVENVVVYYEPGRFAGWPANNGLWSWGNEILVGFSRAYYQESDDRHSLDRDRPNVRVMARNLDGGLSWSLETHDVFANADEHAKPGLYGIRARISRDEGRT